MKLRRVATILAAALALAAAAGADPPDAPDGSRGWKHHHPPGPPPLDGILERHADELGLADETRAQIRSLADRAREESQPLDEQLRSLHEEMRALLEQDAPNADEVMQQADRIGATETELHKRRLTTMLEIRALLTPEQRAKLVELFQAKRERWHARHHGGGGPDEGQGCGAGSRAEAPKAD